MPKPGSTTARGYGRKHQELRARLLPLAYGQPCPRCGKPMMADQALDLGHNDDRTQYTGIEHASCNRRAGAYKSVQQQRQQVQHVINVGAHEL